MAAETEEVRGQPDAESANTVLESKRETETERQKRKHSGESRAH